MGYYSDVLLAVAASTEDIDTLWAAYIINPEVQRLNRATDWCRRDYNDGASVVWAEYSGAKWYEDYDSVRASEHMLELCLDLGDPEGSTFSATTRKLRIGEDLEDIEDDVHRIGQGAAAYEDAVYDLFDIVRTIEVKVLANGEAA